jgi:hypothetical protein
MPTPSLFSWLGLVVCDDVHLYGIYHGKGGWCNEAQEVLRSGEADKLARRWSKHIDETYSRSRRAIRERNVPLMICYLLPG